MAFSLLFHAVGVTADGDFYLSPLYVMSDGYQGGKENFSLSCH